MKKNIPGKEKDDAEDIYGIEAAFDGEPLYMHYLCHLQLFIFIYCTDRKSRIVWAENSDDQTWLDLDAKEPL